MIHRRRLWLGLCLLLASALPSPRPVGTAAPAALPQASPPLAFSRTAIRFEPNVGQFSSNVRFVARYPEGTLFLTEEGATFRVAPRNDPASKEAPPAEVAFALSVAGSRPSHPQGESPLPTKASYFLGSDPATWRTGVSTYAAVRYPNILPGISLVFHGEHGQLEYDFEVAPGADPKPLLVSLDGAGALALDTNGDAIATVGTTSIVQKRPLVYQTSAAGNRTVDSAFRLDGPGALAFAIGDYDRSSTLVIDPEITFATLLGGSSQDSVAALAVAPAGFVTLTGNTRSVNFPVKLGLQTTYSGNGDAYVAKLRADGTAFDTVTYIGGTGVDYASGLAVGPSGDTFVLGVTDSTNFPLVAPTQAARAGAYDAFVLQLDPAATTLRYSTYLGGTANEIAGSIATDATGNAYVTGKTASADFPTVTPYQAALGGFEDGFFAKIAPLGASVVTASYLGGAAQEDITEVTLDATGNVFLGGHSGSPTFPATTVIGRPANERQSNDVFVAKLPPAATTITFATIFGSSGHDRLDGLAVDASGAIYMGGRTERNDFPVRSSNQAFGGGTADGFVTKLSPAGTTIEYSTYLGGPGEDYVRSLTIDASGTVYAIGTAEAGFPTVRPVQAAYGGGVYDAFVAVLAPNGYAVPWSTYLGGPTIDYGAGIGLDATGSIYVAGSTFTGFPTKAAIQATSAGSDEGWIAKLANPLTLTIDPTTVSPTQRARLFAFGGAGQSRSFAFKQNGSGGTVDATSGAYVAGPTGNTTDTFEVRDSTGATATTTVTVLGRSPDAGPPVPLPTSDAGKPPPRRDAGTPPWNPTPEGRDADAGAEATESSGCRVGGTSRPSVDGFVLLAVSALILRRARSRSRAVGGES